MPDDRLAYKCDSCNARGVKLWREYGVYSAPPVTLCVVCACEIKGIDPDLVDENGTRPDEYAITMRTDQIGWYVPAVPADEEGNWWGYTSIPEDGYERWKKLPTRAA
jgi:hypothetical protein